MTTSFQKKVKLGKICEEKIIDIFVKNGFGVVRDTAKKRIEYDFLLHVNNLHYKVEVKFDSKANLTKNFCLEYYNSNLNSDSGIIATTSFFWITYLNDKEIYICKTDDLKKYVMDNKPCRTFLNAGDGNANLFLFSKERLLSLYTNMMDTKFNVRKYIKNVCCNNL